MSVTLRWWSDLEDAMATVKWMYVCMSTTEFCRSIPSPIGVTKPP